MPPVQTKNQEPRTKNTSRHGLTLIELLASFAVLAIIVALLAVALNTATDNWHNAQARTRVVADGRAVMDSIAQNLRQAVATTNFPVTLANDQPTYNATNNWIQFLRILPAAATNQYAIEAIRYGVINCSNGTFRLGCWTNSLAVGTAGVTPGVFSDDFLGFDTQPPLALADGLAALRFSPASTNSFFQTDAPMPPYIDIYLELLSADDTRSVANLPSASQPAFVDRHVLRFTQRVFLPAVNRWNLP